MLAHPFRVMDVSISMATGAPHPATSANEREVARYDRFGVGGAVPGKLGSLCGCSDAAGDGTSLGTGSGSTMSTSGPDPESLSDPS